MPAARIETDPARIRELAEQKDAENWRFRAYLKATVTEDWLDQAVHEEYARFAAAIDCQACANCCKALDLVVSNADVGRIARALNITRPEVVARCFTRNERQRFQFNARPCPLLSGNLCTVYPQRPRACRDYPHLRKGDVRSRLISVVWNTAVCPIVFNVYEALKERLG